MQAKHVSLTDFYMQWFMVVMEVSNLKENQFSVSLVNALTNRLENLRKSRTFKMALYLDPRLNYLGSRLFKPDEKEQIQVIWLRIMSYEEMKNRFYSPVICFCNY